MLHSSFEQKLTYLSFRSLVTGVMWIGLQWVAAAFSKWHTWASGGIGFLFSKLVLLRWRPYLRNSHYPAVWLSMPPRRCRESSAVRTLFENAKCKLRPAGVRWINYVLLQYIDTFVTLASHRRLQICFDCFRFPAEKLVKESKQMPKTWCWSLQKAEKYVCCMWIFKVVSAKIHSAAEQVGFASVRRLLSLSFVGLCAPWSCFVSK